MTKRFSNKYKLLKFYEEDLWGKLTVYLNYKKVKINNILFSEFKKRKMFYLRLKDEKKRLRIKYKLNKRLPKNLREKYYHLFNLEIKNFIQALKIRNQFGFSFRIDIGTPKRLRRKITNYTQRLKSRHILRLFSGGAMNVRQFRNYLKKTRKQSSLILFFFKLFETRLDTLIYRFNFYDSPGQVRQAINHGNFFINGKLALFAGQHIDYFDILSVRYKDIFFNKLLYRFKNNKILFSIPFFLEVNYRIMCMTLYCIPHPKKVFYPVKSSGLLLASAGPRFSSF